MPDFKQQAACEAARSIGPGQVVGFGAGSTMAHLVAALVEDRALARSLKTVSSSFVTRQLLIREGFTVVESGWLSRLDWYFDGCDQFDMQLNALKSGGGVHTAEKVLAAMADQFVLVGDRSKLVGGLDGSFPVVAEVIPEAAAFVADRLERLFGPLKCGLRVSDKKDGAVITERGNFLIDSWFEPFPDPGLLNARLDGLTGVLEHSLFYNMAHRAVVAGPEGIQIMLKP